MTELDCGGTSLILTLQDSLIFPGQQVTPNCDAETNTECVFIQPMVGRKSSQPDSLLSRLAAVSGAGGGGVSVKRSKTFSPSAPINKSQYNCRVSLLRELAILVTTVPYSLIFPVEQK